MYTRIRPLRSDISSSPQRIMLLRRTSARLYSAESRARYWEMKSALTIGPGYRRRTGRSGQVCNNPTAIRTLEATADGDISLNSADSRTLTSAGPTCRLPVNTQTTRFHCVGNGSLQTDGLADTAHPFDYRTQAIPCSCRAIRWPRSNGRSCRAWISAGRISCRIYDFPRRSGGHICVCHRGGSRRDLRS